MPTDQSIPGKNEPIPQTSIIQIKVEDTEADLEEAQYTGDPYTVKTTILHSVGPNNKPLIDWANYSLTSYSRYNNRFGAPEKKPNEKKPREPKQFPIEANSPEAPCPELIQSPITSEPSGSSARLSLSSDRSLPQLQSNLFLSSNQALIEEDDIELYDRGLITQTTLRAVDDLDVHNSDEFKDRDNFGEELVKPNKYKGKYLKGIGRAQMKLVKIFNLREKPIYLHAKRNLHFGQAHIDKYKNDKQTVSNEA